MGAALSGAVRLVLALVAGAYPASGSAAASAALSVLATPSLDHARVAPPLHAACRLGVVRVVHGGAGWSVPAIGMRRALSRRRARGSRELQGRVRRVQRSVRSSLKFSIAVHAVVSRLPAVTI